MDTGSSLFHGTSETAHKNMAVLTGDGGGEVLLPIPFPAEWADVFHLGHPRE